MANRQRGLGKGLDDILASSSGVAPGSALEEMLTGQGASGEVAGDTGWIDVGSTRVAAIRWVPTVGPGRQEGERTAGFQSTDQFSGNLFVRFIKYDTAYVYRGVPRPTADLVYGMGMAGKGIGSYVNSVLNGFTRDYCTQTELNLYFGGYGGTYRGPSGHPTPGS